MSIKYVESITTDHLDAAFRGDLIVSLPYDVAFAMARIPQDTHAESARYWLGKLECRICGHEQMSIWPAKTPDSTTLECDACGHPSSEPICEA